MGLRGNGPNKASTFFSMVDSNKKTAAKDALATGKALTGVYGAGTQARQTEAKNVNTQATAVANTDTNFQDSKTGNVQNAVNQATPVQMPTVSADGFNANAAVKGGQGSVTANPNTTGKDGKALTSSTGTYATKNYDEVTGQKLTADYVANQLAQFDTEAEKQRALQGILANADADIAAEIQEDLARKGVLDKTFLDAGKRAEELNYGKIGQANQMDQNSSDFVKMLAEQNPGNIGLLSMLYGSNYDAQKYGALDSNILQGQLNELRQGASGAISERESSKNMMGSSLKGYYDTVDAKKQEVASKYNIESGETDNLKTNVAKAKDQIVTNLTELENQKAKAGPELKAQIQAKINILKGDLKTLNEKSKKDAQDKVDNDAKSRREKAEKEKKSELSAQMRDKYGVELNPMKAAERFKKGGDDFIKSAEKGDAAGMANAAGDYLDPSGTLRGVGVIAAKSNPLSSKETQDAIAKGKIFGKDGAASGGVKDAKKAGKKAVKATSQAVGGSLKKVFGKW